MSKIEMLRVLINQRLTAAAEEIFGVFGRTIAEYEEEISRSKLEIDRQRRLLDLSRKPQISVQVNSSGETLCPYLKVQTAAKVTSSPELPLKHEGAQLVTVRICSNLRNTHRKAIKRTYYWMYSLKSPSRTIISCCL